MQTGKPYIFEKEGTVTSIGHKEGNNILADENGKVRQLF